MYFVFAVDKLESDLGILDSSSLRRGPCKLENVCELADLPQDKVHYILDEIVMAGMVLETNIVTILSGERPDETHRSPPRNFPSYFDEDGVAGRKVVRVFFVWFVPGPISLRAASRRWREGRSRQSRARGTRPRRAAPELRGAPLRCGVRRRRRRSRRRQVPTVRCSSGAPHAEPAFSLTRGGHAAPGLA